MSIPKGIEQSRMKTIEREPESTLLYRQRRCSRQGGHFYRKSRPNRVSVKANGQPLDAEAQVPCISEVPIRLRERRYSRSCVRYRGAHPAPGAALLWILYNLKVHAVKEGQKSLPAKENGPTYPLALASPTRERR